MKRVYKYPIEWQDYDVIAMPANASVLCAQTQHEHLFLWALVDPDEKTAEARRLRIAGTGQDIDEKSADLVYIDTVQLQGGNFIFHVFEVLR